MWSEGRECTLREYTQNGGTNARPPKLVIARCQSLVSARHDFGSAIMAGVQGERRLEAEVNLRSDPLGGYVFSDFGPVPRYPFYPGIPMLRVRGRSGVRVHGVAAWFVVELERERFSV
jgi:hypothetical protein